MGIVYFFLKLVIQQKKEPNWIYACPSHVCLDINVVVFFLWHTAGSSWRQQWTGLASPGDARHPGPG